MLQGFGDGSPESQWKFHEGIDILADGNGGQEVVAARGGEVVYKNANYNGQASNGAVVIKVRVSDIYPIFEYDKYLHLDPIDASVPNPGAANPNIAGGAAIGKISQGYHNAGSRHLHFDVSTTAPDANGNSPEDSMLNPLLRFSATADKDPLEQSPTLQDTNNDNGRTLLVTTSGTTTSVGAVARGDVDLIADARDPMHPTFRGASGPYQVGYYVKPLFTGAHGVKTADSAYMLARFDDWWFHDSAAGLAPGRFSLVYADSGIVDPTHPKTGELRVNPNPTVFALTRNYIVTNTKGVTGRRADVEDQFWNTNAKERATPPADDVDTANYAGDQDTMRNSEARFRDGNYEVHIILGDLLTRVDRTAGKVRVSNWLRAVAPRDGSNDPVVTGTTVPLYDLTNVTPYLPDFVPTSTVAYVGQSFMAGTPIGVMTSAAGADNFWPNTVMDVYIVSHKSGGWMEGDSLTAGQVYHGLAQSNSFGNLPPAKIWPSSQAGTYDLIVDYDNDGKFSWTLDALAGFTVVAFQPPPPP